jgi:hypothetical protein
MFSAGPVDEEDVYVAAEDILRRERDAIETGPGILRSILGTGAVGWGHGRGSWPGHAVARTASPTYHNAQRAARRRLVSFLEPLRRRTRERSVTPLVFR